MPDTNWKKNLTLFIGGQAITLIGSMVVMYAIFWHITLETKSGTMMMLYMLVGVLPMSFISPLGGVWADRYNRKNVINIADGVVTLASIAVAAAIMLGHLSLPILLACSAVRALGQGVQMPAASAVIPQIVPASHLTKVNGIQSSVMSFCQLASPMLGGALMMFMPLQTMFLLDVVTASIGMSILHFFVKVPNVKKDKSLDKHGAGYYKEFIGGLRYIRSHKFIFRLMIFIVAYSILVTPAAFLTPLQAARKFGDEIWRLTTIEIAFSSGMIAGGALLAMWGGFKTRIFTVMLFCLLDGIASISLGVMPNFWIYIGIMFFSGIFVTHIYAPIRTIIQSNVEEKYMGRTMSVFTMIETSMMPLAMLVFGPIADSVSIDSILIVTGAATILLSFTLLASKTFRRPVVSLRG